MFKYEEVVRDSHGFWLHSALYGLVGEEPIESLLEAQDSELRYVDFYSDASHELQDLYEQGDPSEAVRRWSPTRPEGTDWLLIGIFAIDGPAACFARPVFIGG